MTQYGTWVPYVGSNSIILAVVLFIVTGILISLAWTINIIQSKSKDLKVYRRFYRSGLGVVWLFVSGNSHSNYS